MNLLMLQRYGEKTSIPNIPSDFSPTTCDTPGFLRQNPQMPSISVANVLKNILQSLDI